MLQKILGSPTAEAIMLHMLHFGEVLARDLAKDLNVPLSDMQVQLESYEEMDLMISRKTGTTRAYTFNKKSPYAKPLLDLIYVEYNSMSPADKEQYFSPRVMSRRAGGTPRATAKSDWAADRA